MLAMELQRMLADTSLGRNLMNQPTDMKPDDPMPWDEEEEEPEKPGDPEGPAEAEPKPDKSWADVKEQWDDDSGWWEGDWGWDEEHEEGIEEEPMEETEPELGDLDDEGEIAL